VAGEGGMRGHGGRKRDAPGIIRREYGGRYSLRPDLRGLSLL
jgi:hypothetical protein